MGNSVGGHFGRTRQMDVYLGGLRGRRPVVPFDFEKLEKTARRRMTRTAFAYVAGGAGLESTIAANRAAFERRRIVPRVLRDVSERDPSVSLFGRTLPSPFLLAPIGVLELAHPEADVAVARAAAAEDVPMIFSSQASRSMEECAAVMGDAPRWFQLYWSTSDELVASFVRRAEACGCEALVVTLDTTMLGWRCRDLDLAYLPFALGKGISQYTSDPVFTARLEAAPIERSAAASATGQSPAARPQTWGPPTPAAVKSLLRATAAYPGRLTSNLRSGLPLAAVREFLTIYSRPSLTWDELAWLRALTKLPILLKGLLHPDDARMAVEHGMDGIVVSTHGGRQVDGSIGSLDALPAVAEAVGGRIPIVLDSGVRGGADAFKALALGATAVAIGRPYVYGLALAGEDGVREVIRNFKADFDLTLGLAGCNSTAEIGPESLQSVA